MNFLAHLFLSFDDPKIMIGNFMADILPRDEIKMLEDDILEGVHLHRSIDKYTDNHPAFKKAVESLRLHHNKYAPVVLDILNDHLLTKNWKQYRNTSLDAFDSHVYSSFKTIVQNLPPVGQRHVQILLDHQYLKAYRSKKGLRQVMVRMDKRTAFPSNFESAIQHLYENFDLFNSSFIDLFTDLLTYVETHKPTRLT